MSTKYAIYKNKIGMRATLYVDTKEGLKYYPYIKEESLPVIINGMGGYTSFREEWELPHGFMYIMEIDDDDEPLTREQRYPKNSCDFEYGWIDPDGNTYNTGHEGHSSSANAICEELELGSYHAERTLEEAGWVKVTASWEGGALQKRVFVDGKADSCYITKRQADTLSDLGLWETDYVPLYIHRSENRW